ncbi:helix-turn-helix domain-containing protein [Antrihabitans sp. YC2-6]|uniref:helix-turn-helix domain-containing protein n=1 Tax=Antrihabitans sp. YC2-6 TaxID=2799498 RepID=UPI0018F433A6|nr:helix-turn-helix domain-containing protein [Antrihabitans sp. YC2-6]
MTARGRLKLARLLVEQGWSISRLVDRFQCSPPTARTWADRFRIGGEAARHDRSSRANTSPIQTPTGIEGESSRCA